MVLDIDHKYYYGSFQTIIKHKRIFLMPLWFLKETTTKKLKDHNEQ